MGVVIYIISYSRRIDKITRSASGILVKFGAIQQETRKPTKRFTIPYGELLAKRKAFDAARKDALAKIAATETPEKLKILTAELSTFKWRPFDTSELRAAVSTRIKVGATGGIDAVEHIDGDVYNNHPSNLRRVMLAENRG